MKTLKVKLYPNKEQQNSLRQFLGNTRFIWNKLIEENIYTLTKAGRRITELRKENDFLRLSPVQTLQQTALQLIKAYKMYKKGYTKKPSFKKKKNFDGILIFPHRFKLSISKIGIPKLGWIKFKDKIISKEKFKLIQENIRQIWIKEEPDGFFAYFIYNDNSNKKKQNNNSWIGIDLGLKDTITLSSGEKFRINAEKIKKIIRKIKRLTSVIDKKKNINKKRKIKNSNRLRKLQIRRLKFFKKIKNIRDDFYHKVVNRILNSHEYAVIEDLKLSKLREKDAEVKKQSKNFHKKLNYLALGRFLEILKYKAEDKGCKLIKVNPSNTSRICSNCGWLNEKLSISDRVFRCRKCGLVLDRDINASRNILRLGWTELNGREMVGKYPTYTPTVRKGRKPVCKAKKEELEWKFLYRPLKR